MKELKSPTATVDASRIADEAIAEFLQAAEIGEAPDRTEFVHNHSRVRTALQSFFIAYDQMEGNSRTDESKIGSFATGQQLGRHRLVRPIGSGAFGTVWLGFDSQLKRPVAIKVPNQDRFASQKQRDLFLNEAQTVAQLEHPNIVPIYDVGETEQGAVYLVSRFVPGNDLATEIKNRRYSFDETASCLADIAGALEYAHSRKLVHRDVKPSNILIDSLTGQAFITDFGLARINDEQNGESVAGTPAYMSPEQASGKRLDHRSDVFSLGIVLFEMLCGMKPFTGKDAWTLMKSIREDNPPIPRQIEPQIPDALQTVCLKSLSKTFDDRYDSSEELESDLRAFLKTQTAKPHTELPIEFLRTKNTWRNWAVAVVGILTLVSCLWFAISWLSNTASQSATQASTLQVPKKSIDRQIAEKTIQMGGRIDVRHKDDDYQVNSIAAIPDGDISLLWVMFDNRQIISDEFLSGLRSLDSLVGVDLLSCKFSDSGFAMLGEIESLRYVHAPDTRLSDRAAISLAALPRLRQLTLTGTSITNETLRPFEGCDTLKVLRLGGTNVSDEGLKHIGTMPNLQELNLSSCRITDVGVKHLSSLGNLRIIKLSDTEITGKAFNYLTSLPLLRFVVPSCLDKSAEELEFLAQHPGCKISRD